LITSNCMDVSHAILKKMMTGHLIEPGDVLLAGVSGGVDSVVLLDLLYRFKERSATKVYAAHVNYGLRGRESKRDEAFVKKIAKKYGVPYFVTRPAKGKKGNLQNSARDLRYDFFLKIAGEVGANKIAVAHHADDQAETVLLHLARGTGLQGLSGMQEKRNLTEGISLIRPLLTFTREDILRYVKERGLKFVEDSTNRTDKYNRNVIRNKVLPELKKVNTGVISGICKTAFIISEDDRYLNDQAAFALKKASPARRPFGGDTIPHVTLKRPMLVKYNVAIMKRVLRLAYARLTGSTADLLTDHIEKMMWIIFSGTKEGQYSLPKGCEFSRRGNKISLKINV